MSTYDKGYRDGYMEGLSECGPLKGFTKWFERRGKTKKIGKMKESERRAIVQQALVEYEGDAKGAKERILNPQRATHKAAYKEAMSRGAIALRRVHEVTDGDSRRVVVAHTVFWSGVAYAHAADKRSKDAATELMDKAMRFRNPSKAGSAALGGVAGGLLLGPLGAAAGAYGGVKLKQRAQAKKAKRTKARRAKLPGRSASKRQKNPTVGSIMRSALK
jgi:hypothetical protein